LHFNYTCKKNFCQDNFSFGLTHSIQGEKGWGSNIWKRRHLEVFVPENKKEASLIIEEIFRKMELPPVKYLIIFLERREPR